MAYQRVLYDRRAIPSVMNYRAQNSAQVGDRIFFKGEMLQVDTAKEPKEGDVVIIAGLVCSYRDSTIKSHVMGVVLSAGADDE